MSPYGSFLARAQGFKSPGVSYCQNMAQLLKKLVVGQIQESIRMLAKSTPKTVLLSKRDICPKFKILQGVFFTGTRPKSSKYKKVILG